MIGSAAVPLPDRLLLLFCWGVREADDGEDDPVAARSSAEEYIPLSTFLGAEDWIVEVLVVVVDWSTGGLVPTMVEAWARRVVEPWVPPDMVVPRALSLLSVF